MRHDSDDNYGDNYLQAEATIGSLMHHYNEERLHAVLGFVRIDVKRDKHAYEHTFYTTAACAAAQFINPASNTKALAFLFLGATW